MADDTNEFYHQLKACLESFRSPEALPEVPMTISGIPRQGLTVKYQHPATGPADPADMASEAARVIGAAGIGAAGEAAIGAVVGKAVLGGALARIGVASAGAAIGIPILAPVALVGGSISTAAYAAYKVGKGKRDQESAQLLLERLMDHIQGFSPSVEWPDIDIFVSIPDSGLAAMWQPGLESEVDA